MSPVEVKTQRMLAELDGDGAFALVVEPAERPRGFRPENNPHRRQTGLFFGTRDAAGQTYLQDVPGTLGYNSK